jgi:hypothetical protein
MAEEKAQPTPPKKAAHRSPNYPAFGLEAAIEKIRTVYDEEKRTPTTPKVIAGHLGYADTDGPGGRSVSCLRQFGLLEDAAGNLKVSDLAFSLLHLPDEDAEKAQLLKQAALKPNLYRQLREDYPDTIPSDSTLKSNLLKRGFNPNSIDGVIADFRGTMEIAKVYDVSHNAGEDKSKMQTTSPVTIPGPTANTPNNSPLPGFVATGNRIYAMAFEGEGSAALTLSGTYTEEDLDDLKAYLETSLKTLKRSIKKDTVQ